MAGEPSTGVVVADFTRILAGPYCTMLLGDLGAEVIKVERPGTGDDTAPGGRPFDRDGRATYFDSVNREQELGGLGSGQRRRARRSAATGVARRRHDRELPGGGRWIVSAWATTNSRTRRPGSSIARSPGSATAPGRASGYDPVVQAVGGLMSITGPDPEHPSKTGVAVVDVIAGLHAAMGILAALRHRDRTGTGQRLQVNLLNSCCPAW